MQRSQQQKDLAPLWTKHSPDNIIPATKLEKKLSMLSIRNQKQLSSDVDAACFHLAQKLCLLFETLQQGGVIGTPRRPFVQILNVSDNHWMTASNIFNETN